MALSAGVYIWYPHEGHIGHASMHIGTHKEAKDTQWYVSWWPNKSTMLATRSAEPSTFKEDKETEGGPPHVKYLLQDLDIAAMKAEWDVIRDKPAAHYKLVGKNCSTIVARVLKAGGVTDALDNLTAFSYGKNLYWTPKNIAQLCDQLVKADKAMKFKFHACPTKMRSIKDVLTGLR